MITDQIATKLFLTAIEEGRAGELLSCLFEGGSGTVDAQGRLVLIPASAVLDMLSPQSAEDRGR